MDKITRVLTDEEKRVLDQDWVGRDGSKRKVEVCQNWLQLSLQDCDICAAGYGPTKAQEVLPIRN